MKKGSVLLGMMLVVTACNVKKVNESKEIQQNAKLMDELNKGNNSAVLASISEDTKENNKKIIRASALAQDAGIDVYALLPILKEKVFQGPIASKQNIKDSRALVKKLTNKTEQKIKIKISVKDVEEALVTLRQLEEEVVALDEEFFDKKDIIRIKAALTVLDPNLDNVTMDSKEEALRFIRIAVKEIETKVEEVRQEQEDPRLIVVELNIGKIKKEAVKFMISALDILPVISLTPEVNEADYVKIDNAIKLLESVAGSSSEEKRAKSYVVFLSSVMVINISRDILGSEEDLNQMLCSLTEEKLNLFIDQTKKYLESLERAAKKISEISKESAFLKISDGSTKLLGMEEEVRTKAIKALVEFIEKEKKKICE